MKVSQIVNPIESLTKEHFPQSTQLNPDQLWEHDKPLREEMEKFRAESQIKEAKSVAKSKEGMISY
jgi:hypothetical protein